MSYYKINGVSQIFSVPIGSITAYLGTTDPDGFIMCDGQPRPNTNGKYNALYELVGLGTMTASNYYPPDLRGKFIQSSSNTSAVGGTGGSNSVTLSTSNMPSHSHTGTTVSGGIHKHGYTINRGNDLNWSSGYGGPYDLGTDDTFGTHTAYTHDGGGHTHSFTTDNTGSGSAFSIEPAHIKVNYIIKY